MRDNEGKFGSEVATSKFFVQPGYSVSLKNISFRRTNVNNDLEGPGKGCRILRCIGPMSSPPPGGLLLTLSLEKITFLCLFNPDLSLHCNWVESSQGTGHTGMKK